MSPYYYGTYSHTGYPCPYSQPEGYDYSVYGQAGYPYTAYLITGSYGNCEHGGMYEPRCTDAIQPIIILVENVDKRDEFYLDDLISLSLGIGMKPPNDCSNSCHSTWCSCNSCDSRNNGRGGYEFYSECNRGPECSCDSCKSCSKKGKKKCCEKPSRNFECECHRCHSDSYCDCECCKHILICECY